ncbi:MAG: macro domain-containing protein [Firmicutes bacterium]|nr:macro domain-containing protein [Bacillota bacterium]
MPLEIIRNDITKVEADAIVNTANPEVAYGAGVDSAIYAAAGAEELLAERAKIGRMVPGAAAVTPAFKLSAKYIIHTVGPVWQGGDHGEAETVASCYRNALNLAKENDCESIAFPLIATGTYGFPKDLALKIAIAEISSFLFENDMTVYMVVYDKEAFVLSGKLFSDVTEYIKENEILQRQEREYPTESSYPFAKRRRRLLDAAANVREREPRLEQTVFDALSESMSPDLLLSELDDYQELSSPINMSVDASAGAIVDASADAIGIDERLKNKGATFQESLFRIIDRKGLKDSVVYKKANIDRRLFSKIKSNVDYKPSKQTVLAFAIALELNLDETLDLLGRAGMTLSKSSEFDIIMEYCIDNRITNIMDINCILFDHDQPLLGA